MEIHDKTSWVNKKTIYFEVEEEEEMLLMMQMESNETINRHCFLIRAVVITSVQTNNCFPTLMGIFSFCKT